MTKYPELLTIRDYLRFAMSQFNEMALSFGHGTDNAWDEALALILPTLHLPHDIHPSLLEARVTQAEAKLLEQKIHSRTVERIPVPYLTHNAWFGGLSFYVDQRVLIPRSPLAELIQKEFQPWITSEMDSILDLCTGSGCIAILLAKTFPAALIDASDVSPEALAVSKINVLRHAVDDQVHLYESHLFDALPSKKYDLIISNPPYVNAEDMNELPPEYKHEPHLGLQGGDNGLDLVLQIIHTADTYLKPGGHLIVEVGNSEGALQEALPELPLTWIEFEHGGGGVFLLSKDQLQHLK